MAQNTDKLYKIQLNHKRYEESFNEKSSAGEIDLSCFMFSIDSFGLFHVAFRSGMKHVICSISYAAYRMLSRPL